MRKILSKYTLPTDQQFNLEFQFVSVFNLEFQPKSGIQVGIPISMGINLGECIKLHHCSNITEYKLIKLATYSYHHMNFSQKCNVLLSVETVNGNATLEEIQSLYKHKQTFPSMGHLK